MTQIQGPAAAWIPCVQRTIRNQQPMYLGLHSFPFFSTIVLFNNRDLFPLMAFWKDLDPWKEWKWKVFPELSANQWTPKTIQRGQPKEILCTIARFLGSMSSYIPLRATPMKF